MSERDQKLEALGYPLDDVPGPGAIYRPVVIDGTRVYVSGAVPIAHGVLTSKGKVPSEVSLEEAQQAAALCAANNLRVVRAAIGSLDRIERVLRITGYVNSDADFTEPQLVINGASKLAIAVFGEDAGIGARSAVGVAQLPRGASTEVEMILKLKS
ncbi:MAG: RidA family protein [Bacteroidota bacterium]